MYFTQFSPRLPVVVVTPGNAILPNDSNIEVTDYAGTVTRDASQLYVTRAIDSAPQGDTSNFKRASPAVRFRIGLASSGAGTVTINLRYTGEIARNDPYNPFASVYLDGALSGDISGPPGKTDGDGQPQPVGVVSYPLSLSDGSHTVEVMCPPLTAVSLVSFTRTANVVAIAPTIARPSAACVLFGDSIVHGSTSSRLRLHWTSLLCAQKGWRQINLGYGGRQTTASDFTVAGSQGTDRAVTDFGINDVLGGLTPAQMKAVFKVGITNYRNAATAAGKPQSRLYIVTPFYTENTNVPGGSLSARLATVEAARQAIRDAVSESADTFVSLIEGAQNGMPKTSDKFAGDFLHPNDSGSAAIAADLSGRVS